MDQKSFLKFMQGGTVFLPLYLLQHYKDLGLNEAEFTLLLHLQSFIERGNSFPTYEELASRTTMSNEQCTHLLRKLIQKGFLLLQNGKTEEDILYEQYSLEPMWEKLYLLLYKEKKQLEKDDKQKKEANLYQTFEKEFGRPLSPFEVETLSMWLDQDHQSPELILAALKEAVLSAKVNFRYIDRILFEWKRNGIRTPLDAAEHGRKFRLYQKQKKENTAPTSSKDLPFYNWLEED
ncbi:DNA replication protein DnaD [Bacillus oleivorans]|uniref:DNA replication protein DnaD n=1 Tax=Bacillus oleivorans TaxID=1448271 RepID=A0A285CKU3_9BACI|nr:DnaD domain-containing protein [Bacillus oleivorans]SNX68177.1 DNA replication protein DnaD [Bacillus oleivorans]